MGAGLVPCTKKHRTTMAVNRRITAPSVSMRQRRAVACVIFPAAAECRSQSAVVWAGARSRALRHSIAPNVRMRRPHLLALSSVSAALVGLVAVYPATVRAQAARCRIEIRPIAPVPGEIQRVSVGVSEKLMGGRRAPEQLREVVVPDRGARTIVAQRVADDLRRARRGRRSWLSTCRVSCSVPMNSAASCGGAR